MPSLTRWFIRSSLVYLILSLAAGFLLAGRVPLNLPGEVSAISPVYFHLFMVGFTAQLIFGVVYWMFPKYSREKPRGSERLGWLTFVLLNLGLGLRLAAEPANTIAPTPFWEGALVVSAVLQWTAGVLFVANTWSRVKER